MLSHKQIVAGLDEVGRGCIVGSVMAAVVVLDPGNPISGLTDSKKLSAKRREYLATEIKLKALDWAVGRAEPGEIDTFNILRCSLLAMARAFSMLTVKPDKAMVDGKFYPQIDCIGETVIQGDLLIPEISAASILAKVARDSEMLILDKLFPGYEFSRHKGYPTQLHLEKINQLGVTPLHRKTFKPVKKVLVNSDRINLNFSLNT